MSRVSFSGGSLPRQREQTKTGKNDEQRESRKRSDRDLLMEEESVFPEERSINYGE